MHKNIHKIHTKLKGAKLIVVTKYQEIEKLKELYALGPRDFGENRPQQLLERHQILPEDIRWHMIGRLQRNKVKMIVPFVHRIHSVDSLRLALEIDKQAKKHGRCIPCLIQVKIASEESKGGYEAPQLMNDFSALMKLENLKIDGLMGMASLVKDSQQWAKEFQTLRHIKEDLESEHQVDLPELSMGMSNDFEQALAEGSTMVRIGSRIFESA